LEAVRGEAIIIALRNGVANAASREQINIQQR
jgi:hypothetical protein